MLHRLGIKPSRKAQHSEPSQESPGGAKPGGDVMGVEMINSLFADEKTAIQTLSGNFDRLANSMDRIAKGPAFAKGKLNRIAELGGGSGILGMWFVTNRLCEFCEIFDHAKNPLIIGEKWAGTLSLNGVRFSHKSYAELSSGDSQDFDFVVAEHAVSLSYLPEYTESLEDSDVEPETPVFLRYKELAGAFSRLLQPTGVGLIGSGGPTPVALSLLCAALRERQLAIDWTMSSTEHGLQLYIRPGGVVVLDSTEDEALAILSDVVPSREVSAHESRSLEKIFREGTKYFEVYSEADHIIYRCSIFQLAGLACLFRKNSVGDEGAKLFSAGKMHLWATEALRDARKRSLTSSFIDERLNSIIDDE